MSDSAAPVRSARLVVLLGVDGAGKSAIASGMVASLRVRDGEDAAVAHWARWEPRLLKGVRRAIRRRVVTTDDDTGGKTEPATVSRFKERLFGPFLPLGVAYLAGALADYALQQRRLIRGLLAQYPTVILDRYWYDLVVDAMGNSPKARSRASRFVRRFRHGVPLPRPDVVILLDVDERTAAERKGGENPLEFIRARRQAYHEVAASVGGVVIDANGPVDAVLTQALAAIGAVEGAR